MLLVKILGPGCFDCLAVEEAVILGLGQLSAVMQAWDSKTVFM